MYLLKWLLLVLSAIELLPLTRLWALQEQPCDVSLFIAPRHSNDDVKVLLTLFLSTMVVLRFVGFARGAAMSLPEKWGLIVAHAMEAVLMGTLYRANVLPRRHVLPSLKRIEVDVIMGFWVAARSGIQK